MTEPYQPVLATPRSGWKILDRFFSDRITPQSLAFVKIVLVFGVFLLMIYIVQRAAGAPTAAFGEFPDEPAHYVGGLVARDYLAHALGKDPISFVRDYHIHLPFFALGVWPPFFYLLEGIWMTLFGTGRAAVLWIIAVSAAGLATLLFFLLKRQSDGWTSAAAGAMFLCIPVVQWSACLVMADLTCSLFALVAVLYFARFLETQQWQDAVLFGFFCGISLLTKNSTYYIVLVPPLVIVAARRWDLLRRRALWVAPVIAASLYLPWLWVSRPFLLLGTSGLRLPGFWGTQWEYGAALWQQTAFLLPAGLAGGSLLLYRNGRKMSAIAWSMLAVLPAISIGVFFARVPVQPRLLVVAYVALIFLAAQLCGAIGEPRWRTAVMIAALIVFGAWNWMGLRRLPPNHIHPAVAFVQARDGNQPGAVLVPSGSEGPWIAEFAQSEIKRPLRIFLRPTKLFGEEDWNGTDWRPYYSSAGEMEAFFRRTPVKYCVLSPPGAGRRYPHDELLESVVAGNPQSWELVFESGKGTRAAYRVYENRNWTPAVEAVVYKELYRLLPKYLR